MDLQYREIWFMRAAFSTICFASLVQELMKSLFNEPLVLHLINRKRGERDTARYRASHCDAHCCSLLRPRNRFYMVSVSSSNAPVETSPDSTCCRTRSWSDYWPSHVTPKHSYRTRARGSRDWSTWHMPCRLTLRAWTALLTTNSMVRVLES